MRRFISFFGLDLDDLVGGDLVLDPDELAQAIVAHELPVGEGRGAKVPVDLGLTFLNRVLSWGLASTVTPSGYELA